MTKAKELKPKFTIDSSATITIPKAKIGIWILDRGIFQCCQGDMLNMDDVNPNDILPWKMWDSIVIDILDLKSRLIPVTKTTKTLPSKRLEGRILFDCGDCIYVTYDGIIYSASGEDYIDVDDALNNAYLIDWDTFNAVIKEINKFRSQMIIKKANK